MVVLDQHFDAIPLSVRVEGLGPENTPVGFSDRFGCGNFWAYLIEAGAVRPENLAFIGVADYPPEDADPRRESYRRAYRDFEKRGCSFFPRPRFDGEYRQALARFLEEKIRVPQVYVSLDLDVGSYAATYAARYMDRPGLSEANILDVAGTLVELCRKGKFKLAGLDVMEFNMHFLGLEAPGGAVTIKTALIR